MTKKGPGELEALIAGFLGSVPGAFIVLDKQWRLVYLNPDARELFLSNDESLIGRPLEEVYPRQFSHILASQTIRGLLEGKENTIVRYLNHFRKWFKISAYSSDSGIFIRLEDITQEMIGDRLRIMNQVSVDSAGDMVYWFKPSGHIIYANKASSYSLGFEKKKLASMKVADIYPSFTDIKWATFVEDLKTRGSMVFESSLQASNRSIIPVEVTCNYLVYHGEEYLIAFARDITERKKAEEALRESEELFRTLADSIPNLAWMADAKGWIFWYNQQWYDYTGTTLEEMQGWGWQKVHHPDYVDSVTKEWSDSIASGKPYDNIFPLRGKDGNYRWFLTRIRPIKDDNGNIVRWFGTNTDITERIETEEKLAEAQALAELYLDLMGHDINNMNQVALGYLELADEVIESEGKLSRDNIELIEKPMISLKNSSILIDNVRKLQKIKSEFKKIEICPRDIVEEAYRQFMGTPNVHFSIKIPSECKVKILADELLVDVFTNIIGNAIKHNKENQDLEITIRSNSVFENNKRYCKIMIEDNGSGIPDGRKELIFNRFSRGKTKAKGTGLGLYLVRSFVESYNGQVWVEDRIKGDHTKGSRFVILLPAIDGQKCPHEINSKD